METTLIYWGLYRDSGGLEGYRSIFAAPELAFLYVGGGYVRDLELQQRPQALNPTWMIF